MSPGEHRSGRNVTVANVAPVVGPIGNPITATANFTNAGVLDTHTAVWDWGDGTTPGNLTETGGSGTVTDIHTYASVGAYEL